MNALQTFSGYLKIQDLHQSELNLAALCKQ